MQQLRLSRLGSGSLGRECPSLGLWASLGQGGGGRQSQARGAGSQGGPVVVLCMPQPCILRSLSGHKDRIASSTLPY